MQDEENEVIGEVEEDEVAVIEVPKGSSASGHNAKHRLSGAMYSLKCNVCEAPVTQTYLLLFFIQRLKIIITMKSRTIRTELIN